MLKVYVVNAFTKDEFGGNPAAVVPLQKWLPDALMQQMAAQHNLAETAFIVRDGNQFSIRWFTPTVEVDLCGHATLASAHIFFTSLHYDAQKIIFNSKSGPLAAIRQEDGSICLDFPVNPPTPTSMLPEIENGLNIRPNEIYVSTFDYLAVFNSQQDIENLKPDFKILARVESRGLLTTAPGDDVDFVARCFFPQSGIDEDPVTGSAYTVLAPYWSKRLGKKKMTAIQLSSRKGYVDCEWVDGRVLISGFAKTYLLGEISMNE
jgi:PhzF family phenazine biosynthesis protein